MTVAGGCQCGAVRYSMEGPISHAYSCHCRDCKKQTSSAFSTAIKTHIDKLSVTGELKIFQTVAHSGAIKYCYFCGECGTRLWHSKGNPADHINLKAGTLDDMSSVPIMGHLWVSRKTHGFEIPVDVEQHQTQPDDLRLWYASLAQETK